MFCFFFSSSYCQSVSLWEVASVASYVFNSINVSTVPILGWPQLSQCALCRAKHFCFSSFAEGPTMRSSRYPAHRDSTPRPVYTLSPHLSNTHANYIYITYINIYVHIYICMYEEPMFSAGPPRFSDRIIWRPTSGWFLGFVLNVAQTVGQLFSHTPYKWHTAPRLPSGETSEDP